jgi:hypothetical protein
MTNLRALVESLDTPLVGSGNEFDALVTRITQKMGKTPQQLIGDQEFEVAGTRLQNSVLFGKLYKTYRTSLSFVDIVSALRAVHLITVVARADNTIRQAFEAGFTHDIMLRLPVVLPSLKPPAYASASANPKHSLERPHADNRPTDDIRSLGLLQDKKDAEKEALRALYTKITLLPPSAFYTTDDPDDPIKFGSVKEAELTQTERDLLAAHSINFKILTAQQLLQRLDEIINKFQSTPRWMFAVPGTNTILSGATVVSGRREELIRPTTQQLATAAPRFTPVGVTDLLVTRDHIKRYEASEVAHIENVLKGETRFREHSRKESTETEIVVETEVVRQEERDLQTTDRLEVRREVSQLLKEEASLKAGASLSASYGPTVEFKTYVDGTTNSTSEQALKQATTFSQETVSRATAKVAERVAERRRTRTSVELLELNRHQFENTSGTLWSGHITGIYQWVNKVYEAQLFNYGRRVIYDVFVPEPAAYFLYALQSGADKRPLDLVKPDPFNVAPAQLNRWNVQDYIVKYGVANVEPPPEPFKFVAKSFVSQNLIPQGESSAFSYTMELPSNYEAVHGHISSVFNFWNAGPTPTMDFILGQRTWRRVNDGQWTKSVSLDRETQALNVGGVTLNVAHYAAAFEVMCQVSPGGQSAWQTKAHATILARYTELLREYERKIQEYLSTTLPTLFGRPPEENRKLEVVELKKGVVSLFAGSAPNYALVGETDHGPEIDQKTVHEQGKTIRFFEQAFEWEQMQYRFYPYFWGRRDLWLDKLLNQDPDWLFRDFLRAGGARIVISVRPGFEDAVAHYFLTGEVWSGGDLPEITDPDYLPILQEIRESQGWTNAVAVPGTWEFTVPTTLVYLKDDGDLPTWE